jgi:hypothetical protein
LECLEHVDGVRLRAIRIEILRKACLGAAGVDERAQRLGVRREGGHELPCGVLVELPGAGCGEAGSARAHGLRSDWTLGFGLFNPTIQSLFDLFEEFFDELCLLGFVPTFGEAPTP